MSLSIWSFLFGSFENNGDIAYILNIESFHHFPIRANWKVRYNKSMNRWALVFRILGNINRLKIIKMLNGGDSLNVSDISNKLKISLGATSKHLIILQSLEILQTEGKHGHVFYSIDPKIKDDFKKVIKLFA